MYIQFRVFQTGNFALQSGLNFANLKHQVYKITLLISTIKMTCQVCKIEAGLEKTRVQYKYHNNEYATIGLVVHKSFDIIFEVICLKILHTEFFISCLWPFWGNLVHPLQPSSPNPVLSQANQKWIENKSSLKTVKMLVKNLLFLQ